MFGAFSPKSIRTNRLGQFLFGLFLILLTGASLGLERQRDVLVLHIRVEGDVDSAAMVRELIGQLDSVGAGGYQGVLLEMEAGRVRDDLAWSLGMAMAALDKPVWVWLTGRSGSAAGPEQLELGILATKAWVDQGVSVAWDGPGEGAELMPEDLDHKRMMRERYSALWVALERRGASTRVAEGLLRPSAPLRATRVVAGECELVEGPIEPGKEAGHLTLVEPLSTGGTRGRVPADVAVALHLMDGREASARQVIRQGLGDDALRGLRTERVVVESDLKERIDEGHKLMHTARAEAALAEDTLRRRIESGMGRGAYERAVRDRARAALAVVERGEAALKAFEALAAEHPEVLRTRAPVQADLPGVEETAARAWAREIEYVRRDLAGTRADAMAQAEG